MPGDRGTPVRGSRADSAEQGKCVPTPPGSEATRPCDGTHGSAPSLTPLFPLPGRASGLRYGNSRLGRSHTATQSVRREKARPGSVPAEGSRGDSGPGHAPAPRSPLRRFLPRACRAHVTGPGRSLGGRGSPEQGSHVSGAGEGAGPSAVT